MIDLSMPIAARDHVRGPDDARVTLVEYGNYECLHCRRAYPAIEAIRAELGDRLRFVFRHFARVADFPMSERAAEAAEAANAQGKFWEMHDAIFTGPPLLHAGQLSEHARLIGLDVPRFDAEMAGRLHLPRVRADLDSGVASGVRGTPSFFVDGQPFPDSWDLDGLRERLLATVAREIAA